MFRPLKPPEDDTPTYLRRPESTHVYCENCGRDFLLRECLYREKDGCKYRACPVCEMPSITLRSLHSECSILRFNQWRKRFFPSVNAIKVSSQCEKCCHQESVEYPVGHTHVWLGTHFHPLDGEEFATKADLYTFNTKKMGKFVTCLRCLHVCRMDYLFLDGAGRVTCPNPSCDGDLLDLYHVPLGSAKVVNLHAEKCLPPKFLSSNYPPWGWMKTKFSFLEELATLYGGWARFTEVYMHKVYLIRTYYSKAMKDEYF